MRNIISIDWEDWFHICEVEHLLPRDAWDSYPSILDEATDHILDLLAGHNVRATFFILGYSAARQPELVRRIAAAGHEIAHHSMQHELVYKMSPQAFTADLAEGKALLAELSGGQVQGFRAPQWSINQRCPWAIDALIQAGFTYDSSRAPLPIIGSMAYPETVHKISGVSGSSSLLELPPLVLRIPGLKVPAGGGWGLRIWPLRWIINKVRNLNRKGSPATFFLHPADFVKHRHGLRLPLVKRAVTSYGLRTVGRALEVLLDELEFTAASAVLTDFDTAGIQEAGQ